MSGDGVRAGKAFVEVTLQSKIKEGARQIQNQLRAVSDGLRTFGGGIAAAGAVGTAAFAGIAAAIGGAASVFADTGSELADMSARTGVSAESLGALGYAAQQTGAEMADVEIAIKKMQKSIGDAAKGSKSAQENLASLGLSVSDLTAMSPEQQFVAISEAINAIQDPTMRAAASMEIFGKSGTKILPMIASVKELTSRARELGFTLSDADVAAADALGDSLDDVKFSIRAVIVQIGAAVAGPMTKMAQVLTGIISSIANVISRNRGLVQTFVAVASVVGTVSAVMLTVGGAIFSAGAAIAGLAAFIPAVVAGFTAIAPALPIILAVVGAIGVATIAFGAVAAAVTYAAYQTGYLQKTFSAIMGIAQQLGDTLNQTFSGITAAISQGDWGTAMTIMWAGVQLATLQGAKFVLDSFSWLAENGVQMIKDMATVIADVIASLLSSIPQMIAGIFTGDVTQVIAEALSAGINGSLDKSIANAQSKLDQLTAQANQAKADAQSQADAKGGASTKSTVDQEAMDAFDQRSKALQDEILEMQLGADAADLYRLAQQGVSAEQIAAVEALQQQRNALKEAKKAEEELAKKREDAANRAQAIKDEVATPLEKFQDKMKEIADLEASGDLDKTTAQRAKDKAREELLAPIEQRQQQKRDQAREAILGRKQSLVESNSQSALDTIRSSQRQQLVSRLGLNKQDKDNIPAEQLKVLGRIEKALKGNGIEVTEGRI